MSEGWSEEMECLFSNISLRFGRIERQRHTEEDLLGLLSGVERKNGWQRDEAAEYATPYSLQNQFDRAPWDAYAVRDDLTEYIVEERRELNGLLVTDKTGFLTKGTYSIGVQRQ